MYDPNQNPYAAPSANVNDSYGAQSYATDQVMLATRGSRLAAVSLDSLILFVILVPFFIVIGVTGGFDDSEFAPLTIILLTVMMLATTAYGIYNLILLAKNGQTVGKRIMKIKIVRSDLYTPVDLGRLIVLRYFVMGLFGAIPFIGSFIQLADSLFIFRADQRCLHDMIADTHVIQVPSESRFAQQATAAYNNQSSNW